MYESRTYIFNVLMFAMQLCLSKEYAPSTHHSQKIAILDRMQSTRFFLKKDFDHFNIMKTISKVLLYCAHSLFLYYSGHSSALLTS